jgi:serine/threonine protein kinase
VAKRFVDTNMLKRLRVIAGPNEGASYELPVGVSLTIGRSQPHNDICLNDQRLSRVHCEVCLEGDQVTITDLDSDAGTFVNGKRISRHVLAREDTIQVGESQLRVQTLDQEPAPTSLALPVTTPPDILTLSSLEELSGTILAHFELSKVIGRGHCGLVFRARDLKADCDVALKVFHRSLPQADEEMQRFVKAFRLGMSLRHPNLVTIRGAGRTMPYVWLSMELVEGENLGQRIQVVAKTPEKDWREAFRATLHLGKALDYAHQHQVIHRNITPHNILVYGGDNFLLGDLLLAKALEGSQIRQHAMRTKVRQELFYLAPEQTHGPAKVDARSDLFSLGCCLYALLCGRPPFLGKTQAETLLRIREQEPLRPRRCHPSIPAPFERAILKLLAKDPEQRFHSAAELLAAMDSVDPERV